MSSFKKIVIVLIVIAIGVMAFLYFGVYSEGTRAGVIMKVSKKGVIFKTWEGQMNLETFGSIKSDNIISETFSFSIKKGDHVLFDKLNDAALSGNRVNLKYIERYSILFFRGDTKYFAVGIEDSGSGKNMEQNNEFPRR